MQRGIRLSIPKYLKGVRHASSLGNASKVNDKKGKNENTGISKCVNLNYKLSEVNSSDALVDNSSNS